MITNTAIAPNNFSFSEKLDNLNLIRSLNLKKYDFFWKILTRESKQNSKEVMENIKMVFTKNYKSIKDSSDLSGFLDGFGLFLKEQKILTFQEISSCMDGYENSPFIKTLNLRKYENAQLFSKLPNNLSFEKYTSSIYEWIKNKDEQTLLVAFEYINNLKYNQSEILKCLYRSGKFTDSYEFIKKLIEKHDLDINAVGSSSWSSQNEYLSNTQWAFTHGIFRAGSSNAEIFFNKFIQDEDFNKKINFDANYCKNPDLMNKKQLNLLQSLHESSYISITETLRRFNLIIANCNLTEKSIAQLCSYATDHDAIAQAYDSDFYTNLFSNKKFNEDLFDRKSVFRQILNASLTGQVIDKIRESKGAINPVAVVLDKFLKNAKSFSKIGENHPFIFWANDCNSSYSRDIFDVLFNHYEKEIKQLSGNFLRNIPGEMKKVLKSRGCTNIDSRGYFARLFSEREMITELVLENKEIKIEEKIIFDAKIFSLVEDETIKKYIESIELNAQQYLSICNNENVNERSHYMNELLPKFINKTIENYLHFKHIDEAEAKENVLIQLKLLNKKTFSVLNEELQKDIENAVFKNKVQSNIIKQYQK